MKVICIKNDNPIAKLTINKTYEATMHAYLFGITNDEGERAFYSKKRFITEKEFHDKKFNKSIDELLK